MSGSSSTTCIFRCAVSSVGLLLVYSIARWTGHGFSLDANIAVCVATVVALSLILAAYFTYVSISRIPSEFIVRTKRER